MRNRIMALIIITLTSVGVAHAESRDIKEPKLPNIEMTGDRSVPSTIEGQRKKIVGVVKFFFERYNTEFKRLNNVNFDAVNQATVDSWILNVENATPEQLSQPAEKVMAMIKGDSDVVARKNYAFMMTPLPPLPVAAPPPPPPQGMPENLASDPGSQVLKDKLETLSGRYEALEKQNKEILEALKQAHDSGDGRIANAQNVVSPESMGTKTVIFIAAMILLVGFFLWNRSQREK